MAQTGNPIRPLLSTIRQLRASLARCSTNCARICEIFLSIPEQAQCGLRSCDTEASHGLIAYSNVSAEIGQSGCVHRHPSLGECLSDSWPIDIGSTDPNGRNEKAEARLSVTQPSTRQFSPMSETQQLFYNHNSSEVGRRRVGPFLLCIKLYI